ncbi:MAG TPA: acylphosphatase [Phycisphaerae bacterium]|nr:acylphosphatase [Phycisphaerae bacterium]
MPARRHVYYSGMVQGVGFRYTVTRLAAARPVTGFVKNLADGRVELVAEGPEHEVLGLLADVAERMHGYIHGRQVLEEPATGEFAGFGSTF